VGARAPLDGLARGGYRLVYADQPTDYFKRMEAQLKYLDLTFSLGMIVGRDGGLLGVLWDGPAFKAGLTKGCQIVAVNGRALMDNELEDAIADAKGGGALIELLVRDQDEFRTVRIDYHGGPRYPRLERIPGTPDLLDDILTPRN
jgi:predicted metalloprotease with PDZ domain